MSEQPGPSLGVIDLVCQSVAHAAPAVALVSMVAAGAGLAGGALPLAVLVATGGTLLVAFSMWRLARDLPAETGLAGYTGAALHPVVGFLVAWGYLLAEVLAVPMFLMLLATFTADYVNDELGWPWLASWLVAVSVASATVGVVALGDLRSRVRVAGVAAGGSVAVLVVLGVWLAVRAGAGNSLRPFEVGSATVPGFGGSAGLLAGAATVAAGFIGFEAAVSLAGRTRPGGGGPGRAVAAAALVSGIVFVAVTYGATAFEGWARFAGFPQTGSGRPLLFVAGRVWGAWRVLVFGATAGAAAAAAVAAINAAGRTWRWMVRTGALPSVPGTGGREPRWARLGLPAFGLVLAVWLEIQLGATAGATLLVVVVGAVLLAIYVVVHTASLFRSMGGRGGRRSLVAAAASGVGLVAVVPVLLARLGWGGSWLRFSRPLPYPVSAAVPALAVWFALGLIRMAWLARRGGRPLAQVVGAVSPGRPTGR